YFLYVNSSPAADVPAAAPGVPLQLASGGKALQPIVVIAQASPRVRSIASDLAAYLGRISGAKFDVVTGGGTTGIALGLATDFSLSFRPDFTPEKVTAREDYVLRTHERGVWLLGASDLAVEHAAWDLLGRLGYRQFFPGQKREVVPSVPELKIAVDE